MSKRKDAPPAGGDKQVSLEAAVESFAEFQRLIEDHLRRRRTAWLTIRLHVDRGKIDKIQTLSDDMKHVLPNAQPEDGVTE